MEISAILLIYIFLGTSCAFSDTASTVTVVAETDALITPPPATVSDTLGTPGTTFIGYYSASGKNDYAEFGCMTGYTWSVTRGFGECCRYREGCEVLTACTRDDVAVCESACNSHMVLQSIGDTSPTYWIGCDDEVETATYYRTKPGFGGGTASTPEKTNTPPQQDPSKNIYYKSALTLLPGAGLILAIFVAMPRYLGATRLSRPRVMSIRRS